MNDTGFLGARPEEFIYARERQLEKKIEELEEKNKKLEKLLQEKIDLKELDKKELLKENKKLKEFIEKQSGIEKGERYILERLYKDMIIISTINNPISELKIEFGIKSFFITQDVKDYLREKGVKYEIRR